MTPPAALVLAVLLQLAPGAPAAEVLLPDPPAAGWIEVIDLRLDREAAVDLGVGDVATFDDVDAHVRGWSGPEGGIVVAIGVLLPDESFLDGFVTGARDSAAARGERLAPYPGLPNVERYSVVDEGVEVEATIFTAGSYGFSIQGTGNDGIAAVEELVRRQLGRTPAAPPLPAADDDIAYRLGRAVGGAAGLAAVGTALWWFWRRRRARASAPPPPAAPPPGTPP